MSEVKQPKQPSLSLLGSFNNSKEIDKLRKYLSDGEEYRRGEDGHNAFYDGYYNDATLERARRNLQIKENNQGAISNNLVNSMERAMEKYPWYLQVFVSLLYFFPNISMKPLEFFTELATEISKIIIVFFIEKPTLALINWFTSYELDKQFIDEAKLDSPVEKEPVDDDKEMGSVFTPKGDISTVETPAVLKKAEEIRDNANERLRLSLAAVYASLTEMPKTSGAQAWFVLTWIFRAALLATLSFFLIAQRVVRELIDSVALAVLMVGKIVRLPILAVLNTPLFLYNLPKNLREAWENRATLVQDFKTMLFENRFALPSNVLLTLSAVGVAAVIFGLNPLILGIVAVTSSVSTLFLSQQSLTIGNPKLRLTLSAAFFLAAAGLVFFAFGGTWFPSIADFIPHLPQLVIPLSIPAQVAIAAAGTWFMVYLPTLFTAMVNWATDFSTVEPREVETSDEPSIEGVPDDQADIDLIPENNNFGPVVSQNDNKQQYTYTAEDAKTAKKTKCFLAVTRYDFEGDTSQYEISSFKPDEYIWVSEKDAASENDWWDGQKKNPIGQEEKGGYFPKAYVTILPPPHWTEKEFQTYGLRKNNTITLK
jgi:hypothetical protein